MIKNIALVAAVSILFGCVSTEEEPIQKEDLFVEFGRNLNTANLKVSTDSAWLSGRAVKLNVVGPIYSTNATSHSRANLILNDVLDALLSSTTRMNSKTGIEFSQHFSEVERHTYNSDDERYTYIPALVRNAFADESALNAVIESTPITHRSGTENAEVGFYLDEQAWKNKVIQLSGYKTIKVEGKSRSSGWFRIKKPMPEDASVLNVKNELANMLVYALHSSIREYASIDRGKVMLHSDFEFIVERSNGATYAYIYRDRKKRLEREQKQKLESIDKERVILGSSGVLFIDVDAERGKYLIVRNENYVGKVELVSANNANQRSLIFSVNSWDEQVLEAHFYGAEDTVVVITDKRILFYLVSTNKLVKAINAENTSTPFMVNKSRNLLMRLNGNTVERYTLKGKRQASIRLSKRAKDFVLSSDNRSMSYLFEDGSVEMLSLKSGQWTPLFQVSTGLDYLHQCKQGNQIVVYNTEQVQVYTSRPDATPSTHEFTGIVKSVDCNSKQGKLLVMLESGEINQISLLDPENVQLNLSMEYSGFDRQNSHYVGRYLIGDEFIYGGRDNLRVRSSVSESEINQYYVSLENKVSESSSWLDKSVIDQAVYVMDASEQDKLLYKTLIDNNQSANIADIREFMMEEPLDPILMSNQIEGFNNLGLALQLSEEKGLRVVKELSAPKGDGLSASVPSLKALGYDVDIVELGRYGFDARIYDSFASTGLTDLTASILNVGITESGNAIMLMRSDGVLTLKEFDTSNRLSLKLTEDGIRAAAINKQNNMIVIATNKGILQQFDLSYDFYSDEEPFVALNAEMKSYAGNISTIQFISPTKVMSSGKDQTIKVWDLEKGTVSGTEMLGHTDTITESIYDKSLEQIVSASLDNTIRVWDPISHEQLFSFKGNGEPFVSAIDAESNTVAYINEDAIEIRNLVTRDLLGSIRTPTPASIQAISLGLDANTLFIAFPDRVEARKVSTGELISTIAFSNPFLLSKMLVDKGYRNLILVEEDDVHLINIGRFMLESLRLQQ